MKRREHHRGQGEKWKFEEKKRKDNKTKKFTRVS